jgi:hypothetical protein
MNRSHWKTSEQCKEEFLVKFSMNPDLPWEKIYIYISKAVVQSQAQNPSKSNKVASLAWSSLY